MVNSKRKANGAPTRRTSRIVHKEVTQRTRVSKACDQCRSAREKCNGSRPCQSCDSQGRGCSYEGPSQKRGVPRNYLRALELTLAWLLDNFPAAKGILSKALLQDDGTVSRLLKTPNNNAARELHHAFKTSPICREIEAHLSSNQAGVNRQLTDRCSYQESLVAAKDSDQAADNLGHLTQYASRDRMTQTTRSSETNLPVAPNSPAPGVPDSPSDLIRFPEDALRLLEQHLSFTHSWMPITERHRMLKLIYDYPEKGFDHSYASGAEHAELWSIMALATTQLSDKDMRDEAQQIRRVAEDLVPPIGSNARYEVPHIKAMLLLTLLDISEDRVLAAWLRIGHVVSLLLLFPLLQNLGAKVKKCKQVHLAAFVLEQILASHLRVPTHSRAPFIEAMGFVEEDGLDEWSLWYDPLHSSPDESLQQPTRAHSTLNDLVRMTLRPSQDGATGHKDNSKNTSIVSTLLRNAMIDGDRMQPSILVTRESHE